MNTHNPFTISGLHSLQEWLDRSSADDVSPLGDLVARGPYAQLVRIGMDDVLPDRSAELAQGCLPLLVVVTGDEVYQVPQETVLVPPQGQPRLADRAAQIEWLAASARSDGRRGDFPACYVVRIAEGQTMRQARTAAGIAEDEERLIVGISAAAFELN